MVATLDIELVLVGPNAGKNIKLNSLEFVNGSCVVSGSPDNVAHAINYYRMYWAFVKGSAEYDAAQVRYENSLKETANGVSNTTSTTQSGTPESLSGPVRSAGTESTDLSSLRSSDDASGSRGNQGSDSAGSGRTDTGLPNEQTILNENKVDAPLTINAKQLLNSNQPLIAAILALDPENDLHWNPEGQPMISVVGLAYGSEALTRREVEEAIPGWNRDAAKEEQLKALA